MTRDFASTDFLIHESGPMPWPKGPNDIERAELDRVARLTAAPAPAPAPARETPNARMRQRQEPWARLAAGAVVVLALMLLAHFVAR